MKRKAAISCTIIIILCIAALLLLAYNDFSSKTIIGGADFPTFLFCLRQTISSVKGIAISSTGIAALILLTISKYWRKKHG